MTLTIKVKQSKDVETKIVNDVKHHHFDRNYLVVTNEATERHFYKISTILEIEEKK